MTLKQAIEYEIQTSAILPLIAIRPIDGLITWLLIRRAKRKYKRYLAFKEIEGHLKRVMN